ncbi:hypothetical protein FB451DRAFT_1145336 [Mycena latifolia]|nr:hypothetical protein FB451DRAFT_1145336 [Mycena latifolia]
MAYVAVDSDDRLEEGAEGLQFKSFLGEDGAGAGGAGGGGGGGGVGNADRGYLQDRGAQSSGGFWTVEYYQSYFDVDTKTVLRRCTATLLPSTTDFLSSHLNPADLYGPFWTATTLVLALFLSSSLGASVSSYLSAPGTPYAYDFGLLSAAAGLVYAYALALPVLLWAALRWMGVGEWGVVEAIAVWGYGMFVWIPVAILAVIPVPVVRWALVGIGFGLSGYFLVRNVYPILATADSKSPRLLVLVLLALHAGLALSFKVLFFNYYVVAPAGPPADLPGTGGPVVGAPPAGDAGGAGNETAEAVVEMVRRVVFG